MRTHTESERKPNSIDPVNRWEGEGGAVPHPSTEEESTRIRARAYEIYRSRCARGESGDEQSDWAQAERDVRAGRDK